MIVKNAFSYKGVEYQSGDIFDIALLDIEDRNDIFLRRIGGEKPVSEKKAPAPKHVKNEVIK